MAKLAVNKDLAKKGSANVDGSGRNLATLKRELDSLKLIAPQRLSIDTLVTREPFCSAYELEDETFAAIERSIAADGYDDSQPVLVWKTEGEHTVLDGHRRLQASKNVGLDQVPARVFPAERFDSDEDALAYIHHLQHLRRNLQAHQQFAELLAIDEKSLPGTGKTNEKLAQFFGIAVSTAKRWLSVKKNGHEFHDRILDPNDGLTINGAYDIIKERRDAARQAEKLAAVDEAIEESVGLDGGDFDDAPVAHFETEDYEYSSETLPLESSAPVTPSGVGSAVGDSTNGVPRTLEILREELFNLELPESSLQEFFETVVNRLERTGMIASSLAERLRNGE